MFHHSRLVRSALVGSLLLLTASVTTATAGELLGGDVYTGTFMRINRDNASWEAIGNFGAGINGMAYDSNHDILYGISPSSDNIYTINRQTGRATMVGAPGALGYGNANGLAYDPINNILWGTDNNTNELFEIDVHTGAGHHGRAITGGFTEIEGLGFDPRTQKLYGLTQLQRRIVEIDVMTGAAQSVSPELPNLTWRGLDWDAERSLLYASACAIFSDSPLYSFNPVDQRLTHIGDMRGMDAVQALAFVPEPSGLLMLAGLMLLASRR